ncbi:hypothetical protein MtrunA17_Chr7g0231001 [Medicago truncatula]|uniref:Armadillo repeat only 1 protein n=1 Tax=Medicago truncatula TaxID=3880 RepID=A0A072THJ6_MEDTR|nr:armadillo repeat only 1 protein [Medicago truncatula]RHN45421.1 hypothetical protein MtrunA17_Chr7g0231001 [Medicago truncatula]
MGDNLKQKLADEVNNTPDEPIPSKQYCGELKSKAKKLSALLRQAAPASSELYMQRPMWPILEQTEHILNETLSLILKFHPNHIKKLIFTIISIDAFRKTSTQLENSINNVHWLLHISRSDEKLDNENFILPSIAFNEPILALIWELIASLCTSSQEDRSDAAACLVSLALQSERYGKMLQEQLVSSKSSIPSLYLSPSASMLCELRS